MTTDNKNKSSGLNFRFLTKHLTDSFLQELAKSSESCKKHFKISSQAGIALRNLARYLILEKGLTYEDEETS